jgi:NAD(P)-dependent dehydrogenase (short-subunit alcohol dehydrogenase family)
MRLPKPRAGFGRIDFLANNAGIGPGSIRPDSWQRTLKFWEITPDQWRRFVVVHTTAPLALGERRRARDDDRRPSQGDRGFESISLHR